MSMSIGLAAFPADGQDTDALLSEADRRMYEAKNRKKTMLMGSSNDAADPATPDSPSLASK